MCVTAPPYKLGGIYGYETEIERDEMTVEVKASSLQTFNRALALARESAEVHLANASNEVQKQVIAQVLEEINDAKADLIANVLSKVAEHIAKSEFTEDSVANAYKGDGPAPGAKLN